MKLHNYYTLEDTAGKISVKNELKASYWHAVSTDAAWARYIALETESGVRMRERAETVFVNARPEKGGTLRALYQAEFECPQGEKYTLVTLGRDGTATGDVSVAPVSYEGRGERLTVRVMIYLTRAESDERIEFCSGDNKLVRRLLGAGEDGEIYLNCGTCDYPSEPFATPQGFITSKYKSEIVPLENGFKISRDAAVSGKELLVCQGTTPVVRAVIPHSYAVQSFSATVTTLSAVQIADEAELVYNMALDGEILPSTDIITVFDKLAPVGVWQGLSLGAGGDLKSDPGEEYLAVITASYAEVYEVDIITPKLLLRVPKGDDYVEMCRGGALAVWSSTKLTVYQPNDKFEYSSFSHDIPRGVDRVVVREGNRYHAVYADDEKVVRLAVTPNGYTQIESVKRSGTDCFLGRSGDTVAFGFKTLKYCTIDAVITNTFRESAVVSATPLNSGQGNWFFLCTVNGSTCLCDTVRYQSTTLRGSSYKANGRLLYNQSNFYIYDFCAGPVKIATAQANPRSCTAACLAGRGLFVLRGGKVYVHYGSEWGIALRLPNSAVGKKFTASVRVRKYDGVGRGAEITVGEAQ